MLALKLTLVPGFLLLVTLAGRRWGPGFAGWLAGLPVVGGPILFILALERGPQFAALAATAALSAVFASLSFATAYSRACRRAGWPLSLLLGLCAWLAAAAALSRLPASIWAAFAVALAALLAAPRMLAKAGTVGVPRPQSHVDLLLRMLCGALLTLCVSAGAAGLGPGWSGLLTVFPILGSLLAVFSHRGQGPEFAVTLLRGMAAGMYSFATFCLVLALTLAHLGVATGFVAAVAASLAAQLATRVRR